MASNGMKVNGSAANGITNGTSSPSDPINCIIPIGGMGTRFSKQGYRYPKPLINIIGRPMLLWLIDNLSLRDGDTLWMAVNEDVDDEFRIGQLVKKTFPKIDFRPLRLRHQTKGASETLYVVTQSMSQEHLRRKTVSLDCDTIYWTDILEQVRQMPQGHGGCFYFADDGDRPIFSYIKTEPREDGLEQIVDIAEKRAISNKANTGAYVFPSASQLKAWAAESLDQKRPEVGEYYSSRMITLMIQGGIHFLGMPISATEFSCVGTPEQLQDLLAQLKRISSGDHARQNMLKKRRFCFDLDMTLVGVPAVPGDYSTCPPIERNIRLVQQLYKAGHYIIIQTARRMKTHKGNMGSVLADVGPVTFAQLAKYEIPYHDIHFGKPYADVYVDDLAVNSNLDTMREIGWLLEDADLKSSEVPQLANSEQSKTTGMIAARDFNTIQVLGDKVVKSSKSENILGELYFYSHMPQELAHIFPAVHNVDFIQGTGTYSITMENLRGLAFSHLLVGRSITKGRLLSLLRSLHTIHSLSPSSNTSTKTLDIPPALAAKFEAHSLERVRHRINIYANYAVKLRSRYHEHRKRYDALGPLAASLFSRLNEFLDTYEAEGKGVHAQVIHGDAVFSNAILSDDESVVSFVDVRCQLDNTLTPEGDIHYDLAKVLQSLCGYDHVLFKLAESECDSSRREDLLLFSSACASTLMDQDAPSLLAEEDRNLLDELQEHFFSFIEETYSVRIHRKTLFRITASLFFSLIPLHRPELGPVFLRMCKETLDKASVIAAGSSVKSASSRRLSTLKEVSPDHVVEVR